VESEDDYDWDEGEEECIRETNLEVGELVECQHLPCTLVLIMEGWPDWLLVVPQIQVRVYVFCDCIVKEAILQVWEKEFSLAAWFPLTALPDHEVLNIEDRCVLMSGSFDFVEECLGQVPKGIPMAVIVHGSA